MIRILVALALVLATSARAHEDVRNPAVAERMRAMTGAGQGLRILTSMGAGDIAYDQDVIIDAHSALHDALTRTPTLFAAEERDPKDQAKPEIWQDYAAFTAASKSALGALESMDLSSAEGIAATLPALDAACTACHRTYRVPRR